jgi:hypothetical protein
MLKAQLTDIQEKKLPWVLVNNFHELELPDGRAQPQQIGGARRFTQSSTGAARRRVNRRRAIPLAVHSLCSPTRGDKHRPRKSGKSTNNETALHVFCIINLD